MNCRLCRSVPVADWPGGGLSSSDSGRVSFGGDAGREHSAWEMLEETRRNDPVLGRKIELMTRYIAAHEIPGAPNDSWKCYVFRRFNR